LPVLSFGDHRLDRAGAANEIDQRQTNRAGPPFNLLPATVGPRDQFNSISPTSAGETASPSLGNAGFQRIALRLFAASGSPVGAVHSSRHPDVNRA
jgi:hypothetical protein